MKKEMPYDNKLNSDYITSDIRKMDLNPFTLAFRGASGKIEQEYIRHFHEKHINQIRIVVFIAFVFYFAFGILDAFIAPQLKNIFWTIRLSCCSYMLFFLVFSYFEVAKKNLQPLISSLSVLGGAGIIAMIVIAEPPASYSYYAGLILVFMYSYTFGFMRFIWASAACWFLVFWYEIAILCFIDTPFMVILNNNFFFIAANLIGMAACYYIEYYSRRDYYMSCMIEVEQKKTSKANKDLERRVRQRTSLLISTNEDLKSQIHERKRAEDELRKMHESLEDKVCERTEKLKRMNEKLTKAKEYADASVRSKTEFLANMSHEIRTPMNAIIGMSDLAMNVSLKPSQRKEYLDIIRTSAKSLLGIINDILDLSKIESGKLEFEKTPFKLRELIENVSDMFLDKIQAKGIEFIVDVSPEVPLYLTGDPLRLKQVLVNLISNALKFTDKGEICVKVKSGRISGRNLNVEFEVSDTGIGIRKDKCYDLFEAFAQADGSTSRKYGGTGLGLAICKNIVKMMNGNISVDSDEGEGSRFMFNVELEKEFGARNFSSKALENVKELRTLVVENNRSLQNAVKRMLDSFGFVTGIAENGQAALSVLKFNKTLDEKHLELILIDSELPDMTGVELVEKIKEKTGEHAPRFIIMGNTNKLPDYIHSISKPVKASILFDKVMDIFGESTSVGKEKKETDSDKDIFKDMSVLLVEDNLVNQMVAKEMLCLNGVSVSIANNGIHAVELLDKYTFDAVLMDIQMPEMDGFEATSIIRNKLGLTDIPIIAMTAHAMQGDKEKCIAAGMNYYIAKPIDNKILFETLAKCMAEHALLKADTYSDDFVLVDSETPYRLEGINVNEGIGRMGGNVEKYFEIVEEFCKHFQYIPEEIRKALENNDYINVKNLVHSIKGAAGNISADTIREISVLMEKAFSSEDFDLILKLTGNLENAIQRIFDSLKSIAPARDKHDKNVNIQGNFKFEFFNEMVGKLDKSLEEYDPAESRIYFDEAQKYYLTSGNLPELKNLWQQLETSIYVYQFDEARKYINEIKDVLNEVLEEELT